MIHILVLSPLLSVDLFPPGFPSHLKALRLTLKYQNMEVFGLVFSMSFVTWFLISLSSQPTFSFAFLFLLMYL